jgi:predicted phosphate transport protein (TIGR00153 family)
MFKKREDIVELVSIHSDEVLTCFNVYEDIMKVILKGTTPSERDSFTAKIRQQETIADEKRHKIIRRMLEGGLLVDSRKSLMHMIEGVDRVANLTEDIIQMINYEKITIDEDLKTYILEINGITLKQLMMLIEAEKKILSKYDLDEMYQLLREIELFETKVDDIESQAIKTIYNKEIPLANKMQLKEVIKKVADISDVIEDTSDLIEIVMLARRV